MHSGAEYYRRLGLAAKQRAAHVTDLSLKEAFKDVARHWLALAERVEWLDRQHKGPAESEHKNQLELDGIRKGKEPAILPTPRGPVSRNRTHGFSGGRTD
jgi:hypothetical protein